MNDQPTEAERFAATLRDESVRRVDDRYVHHAAIRNQMREMADTIDRWERMEFTSPPGDALAAAEARAETLARQVAAVAEDVRLAAGSGLFRHNHLSALDDGTSPHCPVCRLRAALDTATEGSGS